MPLINIARGYARLVTPDAISPKYRTAASRIVEAYIRHPEFVTGEKTYSTRVMREFKGRILLKEGSQGVFGMADFDHRIGVAIKIEDGRKTELPPVLNELFRQLGIGTNGPLKRLEKDTNPPLLNTRKDVVGRFMAEFQLDKVER